MADEEEKVQSFYDWERQFRHRKALSHRVKAEKINSLGMSDKEFKEFVKEWKRKNL